MIKHAVTAEQILKKAMDAEMISVEQLYQLLQNGPLPTVTLLDVRTPTEQQLGIIPGSVLFPCAHDLENLENTAIFSASFQENFHPENFDPEQYYILICRTGPRTAIALEAFLQHELVACELLGGITEWRQKGYTVQIPEEGGESP
ncbi:rhodanese-like domain-containing protein [Candidatus Magnetaquicoccus inordinatus]|uniref:rhodanese-like domain-containing protein n=1 Tax=Candidatus Magnetaquicoccus inordinatus TaxID=2496818 RepID=UPI00102B97BA|nr:rhodanese-like domain-containing protein [Candidatus Magnetaquicoccus inordinatus]